MGLQARVVEAEQKGRHQGQQDQPHEALQVQAVPYVGVAPGNDSRKKEKGFRGVEKGGEFSEAAAFFKRRSPGIKDRF